MTFSQTNSDISDPYAFGAAFGSSFGKLIVDSQQLGEPSELLCDFSTNWTPIMKILYRLSIPLDN